MKEKPLMWIRTEIKTPPFSESARIEAGSLLRRLQKGEILSMPHARPLPSVGPGCYELRIRDGGTGVNWRIMYHISDDYIVILDSFEKKSGRTPKPVIQVCRDRLRRFIGDIREDD